MSVFDFVKDGFYKVFKNLLLGIGWDLDDYSIIMP
jgi:hypothetical protein